jgi:2,4-dienoyl-CoA reductase-like NADH-dependent reductase (Old Yellow Enzyme family)
MITSPVQAVHIIATGQADAVIIAREFLRDPYWPLRGAGTREANFVPRSVSVTRPKSRAGACAGEPEELGVLLRGITCRPRKAKVSP